MNKVINKPFLKSNFLRGEGQQPTNNKNGRSLDTPTMRNSNFPHLHFLVCKAGTNPTCSANLSIWWGFYRANLLKRSVEWSSPHKSSRFCFPQRTTFSWPRNVAVVLHNGLFQISKWATNGILIALGNYMNQHELISKPLPNHNLLGIYVYKKKCLHPQFSHK